MSRRISNFFQNRLWNTKPEKMKSTELLSYLWTRFMVILHFRNSHFYHLMYQRKLWYFANRLEADCKNKNFNKRFSFFPKDSRFVCDPAPARHSDLQPRYREWIRFLLSTEEGEEESMVHWFTPRQHRNYLIMTQSYDLTDAVFHDGVGGVTSILESAVEVMETNHYLRRRWTARSQKIMTTVSSWITLTITWWSDIALVPKPCNCRR